MLEPKPLSNNITTTRDTYEYNVTEAKNIVPQDRFVLDAGNTDSRNNKS